MRLPMASSGWGIRAGSKNSLDRGTTKFSVVRGERPGNVRYVSAWAMKASPLDRIGEENAEWIHPR
ncbi:MAG: hypothetical protein V2G45_08540 [bacterium JZ-2024 1]